ncbi:class A beta-lactamase [Salinisphaera sp. Q1T1-3]|nr:class A beta-lactamase [Salinisphaera sp. Q1T1-3]
MLQSSAAIATLFALGPIASRADTATEPMVARLAALEKANGGRLGVAILDTAAGGHRYGYRADERFLMCSTFKLLLVAAVLQRVDRGLERLDRRVVFDQSAILDWAPVTGLNVGAPGMNIAELCEAATLMSDNTAANLLLDTLGGPAGFTAFVRTLGDERTRLDHREPLNNRQEGAQDTTTPAAMLGAMRSVLLGETLSDAARQRLLGWLRLNQTGAQALRAGLPANWSVGDKTGSASNANNDIAIVWPPGRKPLLVTAYYVAETQDTSARKRVLADVGRIVASL